MQHFWTFHLFPFLNSQATQTTVAALAVITGFAIYIQRRKDYKRDAANIVLLEIKNAEENLKTAKKTYEEGQGKNKPVINFPEKLRLMKTESWTKYKYLFVRDFEPEQWETISSFYENCKNFDEAVEHKDTAFRKNEKEIRANIQRNISALSLELASKLKENPTNDPNIDAANADLITKYKERKERTVNVNIRELVEIYNPDKSFTDAQYYYKLLPASIINTPVGEILKQLAHAKRK